MNLSGLSRFAPLLFAAAHSTLAQSEPDGSMPRGEVLARVECSADPEQTYALYLPRNYDPARTWPVVYGFDPSARGTFVVERFREAAERFGTIVAVSNNSRNGPPAANTAAANAMLRDTQSRFAIDRRRLVLAGCSGGGSAILRFAEQLEVQGLIICGAPFGPGSEPRPRSAAIYGTAGIDDFNYPAMRRLDRAFAGQQLSHRLVIVDTGHTWLPASEAVEALLWLEIRAMHAGLRPRDEELIATTFERRLASAQGLPVPEQFLELRSLADDFDGLLDTSRAVQGAAALAGHREIKAWEKQERASEARQDDEMNKLLGYAAAGEEDEVELSVAAWKKTGERAKNAAERHLARRILGATSIGAMEAGRSALASGDTRLAVRMFTLRIHLVEDDGRAQFELARAHARARSRGPAIAALTRASELGFDVAARTRDDSDFALLQDDPVFQRLIAPPTPPRD